MASSDDIMISVQSRFINGILAGTKRVELRRRAPRIAPGTRIWLYDKAPVASVRAVATLATVETLSPDILWERYKTTLGLSYDEYKAYLFGCDQATTLLLKYASPIRPVSLDQLRRLRVNFQPPQFYLKIQAGEELLSVLEQHLDDRCVYELQCC